MSKDIQIDYANTTLESIFTKMQENGVCATLDMGVSNDNSKHRIVVAVELPNRSVAVALLKSFHVLLQTLEMYLYNQHKQQERN